MADEGALLLSAADGDAGAWRRLLELHGPFALNLARARLRRSPGIQPEDLVQEVWASLLADGASSLRRIDPALGLRSYLGAAVVNAARRHLKRSGRREVVEAGRRRASPEAPDEPLLRLESAEALETALSKLEPEDRLLLRWIYWDGRSYEEVARMSGIGLNSLGPTLSRVRARLEAALKRKKDARE